MPQRRLAMVMTILALPMLLGLTLGQPGPAEPAPPTPASPESPPPFDTETFVEDQQRAGEFFQAYQNRLIVEEAKNKLLAVVIGLVIGIAIVVLIRIFRPGKGGRDDDLEI